MSEYAWNLLNLDRRKTSDRELAWIVRQMEAQPLPDGWQSALSEKQKIEYFWNEKAGQEATWKSPNETYYQYITKKLVKASEKLPLGSLERRFTLRPPAAVRLFLAMLCYLQLDDIIDMQQKRLCVLISELFNQNKLSYQPEREEPEKNAIQIRYDPRKKQISLKCDQLELVETDQNDYALTHTQALLQWIKDLVDKVRTEDGKGARYWAPPLLPTEMKAVPLDCTLVFDLQLMRTEVLHRNQDALVNVVNQKKIYKTDVVTRKQSSDERNYPPWVRQIAPLLPPPPYQSIAGGYLRYSLAELQKQSISSNPVIQQMQSSAIQLKKDLNLKLSVQLLPEKILCSINEVPVRACFKSDFTESQFSVYELSLGQIVSVGSLQFPISYMDFVTRVYLERNLVQCYQVHKKLIYDLQKNGFTQQLKEFSERDVQNLAVSISDLACVICFQLQCLKRQKSEQQLESFFERMRFVSK